MWDFLSEVHLNSNYKEERKKKEENVSEYCVERESGEQGNSNTKTFYFAFLVKSRKNKDFKRKATVQAELAHLLYK